jgi:hypothetical protein
MWLGDLSQEDAENRNRWKLGARKFERKTIEEEEERSRRRRRWRRRRRRTRRKEEEEAQQEETCLFEKSMLNNLEYIISLLLLVEGE